MPLRKLTKNITIKNNNLIFFWSLILNGCGLECDSGKRERMLRVTFSQLLLGVLELVFEN